MTRAVVTLATGPHERLLEIALPSFRSFADRHGYELVVASERDASRPPSWSKIPALAAALEQHDEALWLDADVVVIDGDDDLDAPAGCWQAMVEHLTADGAVPNTGVWLIRRPMLPILEEMWAMTRYVHHGWWEQAAMLDLLGYTDTRPVALGASTMLLGRTHFLDAGWNVHRNDRRRADRPRIMHATMYPDREAVMSGWAAATA